MNKNDIFKTLMEACNCYNKFFNNYDLHCSISSKDFYVTKESALVICGVKENNDRNHSISIVITNKRVFNKLLTLLNYKDTKFFFICMQNGIDISIYDTERDIIIYNYDCIYERFLRTINSNEYPNRVVSFTNTDTKLFELYTHTLKLQKLLALKYKGYCSVEDRHNLCNYIRTVNNILG